MAPPARRACARRARGRPGGPPGRRPRARGCRGRGGFAL